MASCDNSSTVHTGGNVLSSTLLFSTGLIGNIIALLILGKHKNSSRRQVSVFYILVTGLVLTDLLGKCLVSPVVFVSYASNLTLRALAEADSLCDYFSFSMSFFGLASMFILFAMALECWLSISHPFFYQEHFTRRRVVVIFPVVYIFCLLFCSLPLVGLGSNKQYCPGTWCFFNMATVESTSSFSVFYATLMAILIAAVLLCNSSVAINLAKMYRRQRQRSNSSLSFRNRTKRFAHAEEVDHLILLVLMSIIFLICSLPLTIRAYIGAFAPDNKDEDDLIALRLASVNSIVNPWVFIIFRTSVFRKLASMCCKDSSATQHLESNATPEI